MSSNPAVLSADHRPAPRYVEDVIRAAIVHHVLGHRRLPGRRGHRRRSSPGRCSTSTANGPTFGRLRPLHTSAVIFAFGGNALIGTSFYVVQRTCRARGCSAASARLVRVLGLPVLHRHGGDRLPARHHPEQGIRRAGMVRRPLADGRLGRLPDRLPRHDPEAQGAAHLRGELVLPRLHRHHRDAAHRQQPGDAGRRSSASQELLACSRACRMR